MKLFQAVIAVSVVMALVIGCGGGTPDAESADVVVIISPHNPHIQSEFSKAFRAWHQAKYGRPADVKWRNLGGTVQILQALVSDYAAADKRGEGDKGIGVDLFFGGGPAHAEAKAKGLTVPASIPDDILASIPAKLHGVSLRDPENYWFGTAMSSFGIIYYAEGLKQLGLDPPQRWADLADPRYFGRLILADGSKSGSARACYEMVLQKYGWEKGLPLLLRIAANTRQLVESSSTVPREVAKGSVLAGMCIDFYGYSQIDLVGADKANFVLPIGETAIAPDPISLLRGAPHRELAEHFIEFCLSDSGQRLWALRAGTEGGPIKHSLYRLPVLPDIYTKYEKDLVVYSRPFTQDEALAYDQAKASARSRWLGWLLKSACIDNQDVLRQAYKAMIDANMPTAMVAEFDKLPSDEPTAFDLGTKLADSQTQRDVITKQWYDFFRTKYKTVIRMAN